MQFVMVSLVNRSQVCHVDFVLDNKQMAPFAHEKVNVGLSHTISNRDGDGMTIVSKTDNVMVRDFCS